MNWHAEDATAAEKAMEWFAAGFHLGKLADLQPWDASLRLREGESWLKADQKQRAAVAFVRAALAGGRR